MIIKFQLYIQENNDSLIFDLLEKDEMHIKEIVQDSLINNWNKYSIIELDMFYVFKNNFTNSIFKIGKTEIIKNKKAYSSIRKSKDEN